jgi:hypothetical protein
MFCGACPYMVRMPLKHPAENGYCALSSKRGQWWCHHHGLRPLCQRRHRGRLRERADLGRIVGILIGRHLRHDHAAGSIDRQMQLAPFPARLGAMPRLQPLTRPATWSD